MKKISLVLAIIVIVVVGYWIFKLSDPYYGLVTEIEVQSEPETVAFLEQQLAQSLSAIDAAIQAGESPDLDLYILAAQNAYYLGDLVQAREIYDQYFERHSINPAAWNTYANILYKMEDWELAEQAYRTAVELNPTEAFYMDLVRLLARDEGRTDEILEVLEEAVEVVGQTRPLMINLAEWYWEQGDCERAIAHFNVAKTLSETQDMKDQIQGDIDRVEETCEQK